MSSSSLGNIQTPQGAVRISRIDVAVDAPDTKGFVLAGRLLGSNMSEQNLSLAGSCGDVADAGGTAQFNMIPTNFPVVGVNNIDLQVAFSIYKRHTDGIESQCDTVFRIDLLNG